MAEQNRVQVCYATTSSEYLRDLDVVAGTTSDQAIRQSGILEEVAGIDLHAQPVGLYGKKRPLDTVPVGVMDVLQDPVVLFVADFPP